MAQNELVAAKVESLAHELALAMLMPDAQAKVEHVGKIEVWLCDFAKAVRAGEFD
jgi:hypothetical protein